MAQVKVFLYSSAVNKGPQKQLAGVGAEGAGGSGDAPADGADDDLDAMLRSLNQK